VVSELKSAIHCSPSGLITSLSVWGGMFRPSERGEVRLPPLCQAVIISHLFETLEAVRLASMVGLDGEGR
jgi:hypothetical protein